ncbi:protein-tyrosine-phosphatase [Vibrio nigripulchritudo]|nr:protein-tyrosine-phosphatase [Vibrio nigripulchritudo]BDU30421.1 protein-tyrosine-phosphatase [Vibrio nigripulchritudo]
MKAKISKVLVVCLGNICRSPTGEAILRAKAKQSGVDLQVDSAGTAGYHIGENPDSRSMQAGKRRGYSFQGIRSRKVEQSDFEEFDLILAADHSNLSDLEDICPQQYRHKLKLFLSYGQSGYDEIPDPYYGGEQGFELVIDLIEEASDVLLKEIAS